MAPAETDRLRRMIERGWLAIFGGGALALFSLFGNSARGYIASRSLFKWWTVQWFDPAADAEWGPLIVAVALGVWIWNWLRLRQTSAARDEAAASGTRWLVGGLLLHVLGYAAQQTRVSIIALLMVAYGLLAIGSPRAARAARFPLLFCTLAIPFGFLEPLGFYLRLSVSESTEAVMRMVGLPILRNGTQLFAPDGKFQYDVAAACSGIRSMTALVALAALIGYVQLRRGWTRAGLVLLTAPFAFLGNLARILAIIQAAQHGGQIAGEKWHTYSGWVVFIVVLGLTLFAAAWLRRGESSARSTKPEETETTAPSERSQPAQTRASDWKTLAGSVVLLIVVAVSCRAMDLRLGRSNVGMKLAANGIDPVPLPEFIGTEWIGQRVDVTPVEREILPPDTGYSRRNYVAIADLQRQVFVSFVLSGRDRTSIHRPELCLVGQGWTVRNRHEAVLDLGADGKLPVTWLDIEHIDVGPSGEKRVRQAVFVYTFIGPAAVTPSHAAMVFHSSWDRLRHLRSDRWAYLVLQTWKDAPPPEIAARLSEVFQPVWESVRQPALSADP